MEALSGNFTYHCDQNLKASSKIISKKLSGKVSLQTFNLLLKCTESVKLPRLTFNLLASPVIRFEAQRFCEIVINDFVMSEAFVTPANWVISREELHIPCVMTYNENINIQELTEFYKNALQNIQENDYKSACHVGQLMRLLCSIYRKQNSIKLNLDLITYNLNFCLTSSQPQNVVPTALYKNVTNVTANDLAADFQMGYLAFNNSQNVLLVLRSDPKIQTLAINGIWVVGPNEVDDNFVWTACVVFLKSPVIENRVLTEGSKFTLIHIPSADHIPRFYECSPTSDYDKKFEFSLQEAVLNLDAIPMFASEFASFEFHNASSLKHEAFHNALKKFQNNPINLNFGSCSVPEGNYEQKIFESIQQKSPHSQEMKLKNESIPRTSPNPHQGVVKMPVPSVPDPSLILVSDQRHEDEWRSSNLPNSNAKRYFPQSNCIGVSVNQNLFSTPLTSKNDLKLHDKTLVPSETIPRENFIQHIVPKRDSVSPKVATVQDFQLQKIQDHIKKILYQQSFTTEDEDNSSKLLCQNLHSEKCNHNFPSLSVEHAENSQSTDIRYLNDSNFPVRNDVSTNTFSPYHFNMHRHSTRDSTIEPHQFVNGDHLSSRQNTNDGSFCDINSIQISEMCPSVADSFNIDMPDYQETIISSHSQDFKSEISCHKKDIEGKTSIMRNYAYAVDDALKYPNQQLEKVNRAKFPVKGPRMEASVFDSFAVTKLKYDSQFIDDAVEENNLPTDDSFQINKMAMKYLADDYLSNAIQQKKKPTPSAKNKLVRKALMNNQFGVSDVKEASDKTLYGIPCLSFASKDYLEKYGLIPRADNPVQGFSANQRNNDQCGVLQKMDKKIEEEVENDFERILDITTLKLQPKLL